MDTNSKPRRSNPIHYGWIIVLRKGTKCKALPASGTVLDNLSSDKGLPSLCGVWNEEQEAKDAVLTLPLELQPLAEVLPVTVKVRR